MKKLEVGMNAILVLGLVAGCGGTEDDLSTTEEAICADWPDCTIDDPPDEVEQPKPNLIAEIAAGAPCPLNNGQTITVRVKNSGNATAGKSVLRVRQYYRLSNGQYYDTSRYYLIRSLGAGSSATSGVELGDGVNGIFISNVYPNGGDGATFPLKSPITFLNGPRPGFAGSTLLFWELRVDTSFPQSWFNWYDSTGAYRNAYISYSSMVSERSESDNTLGGNGYCLN
jgi:hypothetical protein